MQKINGYPYLHKFSTDLQDHLPALFYFQFLLEERQHFAAIFFCSQHFLITESNIEQKLNIADYRIWSTFAAL